MSEGKKKFHGVPNTQKSGEAAKEPKASDTSSTSKPKPKRHATFTKNEASAETVILVLATTKLESNWQVWLESQYHVTNKNHPELSMIFLHPEFEVPVEPRPEADLNLVKLRVKAEFRASGDHERPPPKPTAPDPSFEEDKPLPDNIDYAVWKEQMEEWRKLHRRFLSKKAVEESILKDAEAGLQSEIADWGKAKRLRKLKVRKLYSDVRATISKGSIAQMEKKTTAFKEIEESCDISGLLKLAREIHSQCPTADKHADIGNLLERFHKIFQHPEESNYDFWQRFMELRTRYDRESELAGCGVWTESRMAYKFLRCMQPRPVWTSYITYTSNLVQSGVLEWPQSVNEAHEAIEAHQGTINKKGGVPDLETSFAATTSGKPKSKKRKAPPLEIEDAPAPKAKQGKSSDSNSNSNSSNKKEKKQPPSACLFCLGAGVPDQMHWKSECSRLKEQLAKRKEVANLASFTYLCIGSEEEETLLPEVGLAAGEFKPSSRESDSTEWVGESTLAAIRKLKSPLKPTEAILDTGCVVRCGGIIREEAICSNIRAMNGTSTVTGLGAMPMNQVCDVELLGEGMYFNRAAPVNILSFVFFSSRRLISYNRNRDQFLLHVDPNVPLVFKIHPGTRLHVADLQLWWNELSKFESANIGVTMPTVASKLRLCTEREKLQMAKVDDLVAKSGFAGDTTIMRAIKTGAINGVNVSSSDFAKRVAVFGPNIHRLRGNLTDKTITPAAVEFFPRPVGVSNSQILLTDLFFVDGLSFIIIRAQELRYVMVIHIASRSKSVVGQALSKAIAALKARNFAISAIVTDGEPAILALQDDLGRLGVKIMHKGGTSVHEVERDIRTVKARARSILDWLPYRLCKVLLVFLILYAGNSLNNFPRDPAHAQSPNELISGFKPDAKKMVAFGQYVMYPPPDINDTNRSDVKKARGLDGIIVASPHSVEPAAKVWSLTTKRIVTVPVPKLTFLPIPQSIVSYLNGLANSEAISRGKVSKTSEYTASRQDLTFQYRGTAVDDDQVDEDVSIDTEAILGRTQVQEAANAVDLSTNLDSNFEDQLQTIITGATEMDHEGGTTSGPDVIRLGDEFVEQHASPQTTSSAEELELRGATNEPEVEEQHVNNQDTPDPTTLDPHPDDEGDQVDNPSSTLEVPTSVPEPLATASEQEVGTRRSTRKKTPQDYSKAVRPGEFSKIERGYFVCDEDSRLELGFVHMTTKKAIQLHKEAAMDSISKEIQQLSDKKVFKPADVGKLSSVQLRGVIRSSMFLKEKFSPSGVFEKLKSRLVAGGHMQDRSLYRDEETSSPTVAVTSVFIIAAIAAAEKRHVATVDIPGAYLNADLDDKEIIMKLNPTEAAILVNIDPNFRVGMLTNGCCLVRLAKALYGLVEAAVKWHKHITSFLVKLGFVANPYDWCVFNYDRGGKQITVCLHVDDLFITSLALDNIEWLHHMLVNSYGDLPLHQGPILSYIGMTFDYSSGTTVKITQDKFTQDLLREYPVMGKVAVTPALDGLFKVVDDSEPLNEASKEEFHSITAKLLYLAKRTRPDLLLLCSYLTTRVQSPNMDDKAKLVRGLRYLQGTQDMGLKLGASSPMQVVAYTDASFAVHPKMVSHTGMTITLGCGPIFAKSVKQRLNTKSSTECELVGLSDSSPQVIWTRNFTEAQGYDMRAAKINQDNQSTIVLANKGRSTSDRTRHVDIRYFFIKDRIDSGEIEIEYLPTEDMIADILTKPLQGATFQRLRDLLLNTHAMLAMEL